MLKTSNTLFIDIMKNLLEILSLNIKKTNEMIFYHCNTNND